MSEKQGQATFSSRGAILAIALLAGCAAPAEPQPAAEPAREESLLPGSIGVVVQPAKQGVAVAAVREDVTALRAGDLIQEYNGAGVTSVREFNRLVLDSRPGTLARLKILREGSPRRLELWVRQLDTMPRV